MIIKSRDRLPYPVLGVYTIVRDHQADLVPYMPDVKAVEVVEKKELEGNQIELVNHWHGATEIPSLIKKFIKPEMMSWKDFAHWYDDELYVSWRLETFYLKELFTCKGKTSFIEIAENETEMAIEAELVVNAKIIPGLPSFLAKKISPQVETFIAKLISPNLNNLAKGVLSYLNDQK